MSKRKGRRKYNNRPMPGKCLTAWRTEMGLAERDAAKRLGISRGGLRNAEEHGATLTIALACAAIKRNIQPYCMSKNGEWQCE